VAKRQTKPTMSDVSRLAGVSKMTVSRVLTEPALVAEETRNRVLQAIEQLRYVPDRVAGSLSSRRTGFVAAILPTLMNANFADTAHGLTEELRRAGYQLLIGYTLYRLDEEENLIRAMLARRPEAIVLTGMVHTREATRLLLEAGVPVVEIWDIGERPIDQAVGFSNDEIGRVAARTLIGLGHRRIGALGPAAEGAARDFRGEDRLAGFIATLREAGLADDLILRHPSVPLSFTEGANLMGALLDRAPDVEAVFAVSDLLAVGAIMECHRRCVRVPETVSILGFGDFEIGRQCVPSLSTIRIEARAIGRRAAEVILEAVNATVPVNDRTPVSDLGFHVLARDSTRAAGRSRTDRRKGPHRLRVDTAT
jgi:LacI family transcriptional regulator, gluconate utilization system Gnt-I transcriptional repressor